MMVQKQFGNGEDPPNSSHLQQILQQGIEAHRNQQLDLARNAYAQILQIQPNHPQALHYLGLIERDNNQLTQACQLFRQALVGTPNDATLHYNLALTEQQLGNREGAINHYRQSIKLQANFPQAYNNLGVILQECGLHDEAAKTFRNSLKYDPKRAETYYNLTQGARYYEENDDLLRIQGLLKQPGLSQHDQSLLHYSLGKIYNDLKQYDQAFNHYRQANELNQHYFDPDTFGQYVQQVIDNFTADYFTSRRYYGNSDPRPVFIVGMPRSGTTLVEQILTSHSGVYGGGELAYINTIASAIPQLTEQNGLEQAYEQLNQDLSYQIANNYLHNISVLAPNTLCFIDKAPLNFVHLGLIALLFPKAHIIHVQRDPRDTCLSCYFQNFNEQHAYSGRLDYLAFFYQQYQKLMTHWQQHLPLPLHTIQYEELVANKDQQTRKLIGFLGLEWEESCLNHQHNIRRVSTASQWQARQPIYNHAVGRWKHYASHIAPLKQLQP